MKNLEIMRELAGQNSRFNHGIYLDAYLFRLNQLYPFDETLNGKKDHLLLAHLDDLMEFYQGVTGDDSGDDVLRCVLVKSLDSTQTIPRGLWQPEVTSGSLLKKLGLGNIADWINGIRGNVRPGDGFRYGIRIASDQGYVIPVRYRNNLIVLPSEKFVKHCSSVANASFKDGGGI